MKTVTSSLPASTAIGCCSIILVIYIAWMIVCWWTTGILVDWANAYYHLGLTGQMPLAFHVLIFLVLTSIVGAIGRIGYKGN